MGLSLGELTLRKLVLAFKTPCDRQEAARHVYPPHSQGQDQQLLEE